MSKGYVYILSNEAMPGLLKIGKTTRDVNGRANELYQTGVPTPFKVEAQFATPDCDSLEARVHESLGEFRLSPSREFFRVDLSRAEIEIQTALETQIIIIVTEYLPDHFPFRWEDAIDPVHSHKLSQETGEHECVVNEALNSVTADEIAPALARVNERIAAARAEADVANVLRVVGDE